MRTLDEFLGASIPKNLEELLKAPIPKNTRKRLLIDTRGTRGVFFVPRNRVADSESSKEITIRRIFSSDVREAIHNRPVRTDDFNYRIAYAGDPAVDCAITMALLESSSLDEDNEWE